MRISIIDNFLLDREINLLLNFYQQNNHLKQKYRNTFPISLGNLFIDIKNKYNKLSQEDHRDWWQIVHWPKGSFQNSHKDNASEKTTLSSITYLNDSFEGGETFFVDGAIVKPKKGRTLLFDGKYYLHGVNPIINGNRFTIAAWYKKHD